VTPFDAQQMALAEHYLGVGQPQRTLELLSSADGDSFERVDYWHLRSGALYELKRYQEAIEAAGEGLARDPHWIPLLYVRGMAEGELERLPDAERTMLAALELDPQDPFLLCGYARLVARAGQFRKAERLVEEAARVDPENPRVLHMRSFLAYLRGHDRKAKRLSEDALSVDPEDSWAHRMRGAALLERGNVRGARRSFETAIRDDPTDRALGEAVRGTRIASHPLLWPVWPAQRLGVVGSWLVAMVLIIGLGALGLGVAAAVALFAWIGIVIYSWTVAPLVVSWLERRARR
jgi:tetratricopeptide (TPR) repeat protein